MQWLRGNWAVIMVFVLAVALVNQWTARQNDKEIARVESARDEYRREAADLEEKAAGLQARQEKLSEAVAEHEAQIEAKQRTIARLEEERAADRVTVARLLTGGTDDELVAALREVYPSLTGSTAFGVIDVYHEEHDIKVPYLMIPAGFTTAFVAARKALMNYREQVEEYGEITQLYQRVVAGERKIFELEREQKLAYKTGYEEGIQRYMAVTDSYIEHLSKPMFDVPTAVEVLTCAGAGAVGFIGVKKVFD